jgi:ADP-heptose:LPS heptosyltransferase
MATAEARYYNELHKLPVLFFSPISKRVYWVEDAFKGNPRILKDFPGQGEAVVIRNFPGHRPYYEGATSERYIYNYKFKNEPGELYLTEEEKAKCLPGVVIVEPHTKQELAFSRNKAWPWERWQELVKTLDLPWVQLGAPGLRPLEGVRRIETPNFRDALGYLNSASLLVTTDGALHHAAAALKVPAVVLWTGASDPKIAGYKTQTNLRKTNTCGSKVECEHCKIGMERISVEMVADAIQRVLERGAAEGRGVKEFSGRQVSRG